MKPSFTGKFGPKSSIQFLANRNGNPVPKTHTPALTSGHPASVQLNTPVGTSSALSLIVTVIKAGKLNIEQPRLCWELRSTSGI